MTLTPRHRRAAGMTILELTVVVLVLLSLIAILFVGARAWKTGSDRAGCIMNLRRAQQAVRSYQNVNQLDDGATFNVATELMGPGKLLEVAPRCPGGGDYNSVDHIPYPGEMVMTCTLQTTNEHLLPGAGDW